VATMTYDMLLQCLIIVAGSNEHDKASGHLDLDDVVKRGHDAE
jgi:hypothetical protein